MLKYLKSAFWVRDRIPLLGDVPVNFLAVCVLVALGFGHPAFWLIGLFGETAFLWGMTANSRFRKLVDALEKDSGRAEQESAGLALTDQLAPEGAGRYRLLGEKLRKVETYYHDFASDDLVTGTNIENFRQLRHCYLRLLIARQHLASPQSAADELKIRAAMETLENELQSARFNSATRQSKEATLEITRKRLAVLEKRAESLIEIDSDLGRIEAQFDLAVESAMIRAKPGEIRFDLDFASRMIVTVESFDLDSLDYPSGDYAPSSVKPLAQ